MASNCPDCGSFVQLANIEGEGDLILNIVGSERGPDRYRIKSFIGLTFESIDEDDLRWAYPAHRATCMGGTNGGDEDEGPTTGTADEGPGDRQRGKDGTGADEGGPARAPRLSA